MRCLSSKKLDSPGSSTAMCDYQEQAVRGCHASACKLRSCHRTLSFAIAKNISGLISRSLSGVLTLANIQAVVALYNGWHKCRKRQRLQHIFMPELARHHEQNSDLPLHMLSLCNKFCTISTTILCQLTSPYMRARS